MGEMIGKCPKCGEQYYGWALNNPDEQYCEICGCSLEIYSYKDAADLILSCYIQNTR